MQVHTFICDTCGKKQSQDSVDNFYRHIMRWNAGYGYEVYSDCLDDLRSQIKDKADARKEGYID